MESDSPVPLGDVHDGWQKFSDGHDIYYYNAETDESSWTPPEAHPHHHAQPWVLLRDNDTSLPYYHNHKTGETMWEMPPGFVPPEDAAALAGSGGGASSAASAAAAARANGLAEGVGDDEMPSEREEVGDDAPAPPRPIITSGGGAAPRVAHAPRDLPRPVSTTRAWSGRGVHSSPIARLVKGAVSKKKHRFKFNGFDLDLSYVHGGKIIAMGWPSIGAEGLYRNHIDEVARFFDEHHPNQFKIYNLCAERHYDSSPFGAAEVVRYPFPDHNPPPLSLFLPFCKDIEAYLARNDGNVAVIHCKAGKGRTGTVISAYTAMADGCSADEAMNRFGAERASDGEGVTIRSQRRFVRLWDIMQRAGRYDWGTAPTERRLMRVTLHGCPRISSFSGQLGCVPHFEIMTGVVAGGGGKGSAQSQGAASFASLDELPLRTYLSEGEGVRDAPFVLELATPLLLVGDVQIFFYDVQGSTKEKPKKKKMFSFWWHTSFIDNFNEVREPENRDLAHLDVPRGADGKKHALRLGTDEFDGLKGKGKKAKYPPQFAVELSFLSGEGEVYEGSSREGYGGGSSTKEEFGSGEGSSASASPSVRTNSGKKKKGKDLMRKSARKLITSMRFKAAVGGKGKKKG